MNFYYVNSKNERIDFYGYPYVFQEGDLIDYGYSYTKDRFGKIKDFRKEAVEKRAQIAIISDKTLSGKQREEEFYMYLNKITEIVDYDTANGQYGRLYTDTGFYLLCNVVTSKKTNWSSCGLCAFTEFVVLAPDAVWVKEKEKRFGGAANSVLSDYGFDYAYDYAYDYASSLLNQRLVVDGPTSSHFVMIIYGSCENPAVSIGTHTYKVNTSLITGEYLTIDSMKKKITKTTNYGEKINVYDLRDRTYINFFEKIPAGPSPVAWSGSFGFDITLYMERSEPAWT